MSTDLSSITVSRSAAPVVVTTSVVSISPPSGLLTDHDVDQLHDTTPADEQQARERALFHAWRAGDAAALGELLDAHYQRIFAVCAGMCGDRERAQDLTQDALVKIIQGLPDFGFRSRLSTWMTRIAINVCLTDRRRGRLRRTVSLGFGDRGGPGAAQGPGPGLGPGLGRAESWGKPREPGPEEIVQSQEDRDRLALALGRLEPEQRAIVLLRDGQDFNYAELATILGVAEGTVKSRLFRARMALRKELERTASKGGEAHS